MRNNSVLKIAKNMSVKQNVSFRVIDEMTGRIVQEHSGHNSATNSLIFGIAHHLIGDFLPNEGIGLHPGYEMLANYVPRYMSLGTMGLIDQQQDAYGLPSGIGDTLPSQDDPEYRALLDALDAAQQALEVAKAALAQDCPHPKSDECSYYPPNSAKCLSNDCPDYFECPYYPAIPECEECLHCSNRVKQEKQAVEDAQAAYDAAYDAVMAYTEEFRFVDYMTHLPGYGADGYAPNENNDRQYMGLGYAWSSYDVTKTYEVDDRETYKGTLYRCIQATPSPARQFDATKWEAVPDAEQPSLGTTIKMELISPSFPREPIAYRDIVPEYEAELPGTIDVVFSAMISTGALKQFRPKDQDYIFITEAGLWSKRNWEDNGENGLLAGYRIVPPNKDNWDMTDPANREILKRQILKVGKNQVVQVIWKIQIGAVDEFPAEKSEPNTWMN